MRRFEAFKLEISNKRHKLQVDILPHPPELIKNIPGKFQVFLNGENSGFIYRTFDGWRANRLKDYELVNKLVEKICFYYKYKHEVVIEKTDKKISKKILEI